MLLQVLKVVPSAKVDTIAQIKYIHDTIKVAAKEVDTLELINKVDIFYNNAWTKLVIILPVLIGVVAVLIPFLTAQYQKREMKHSEAKLLADIEKKNKEELDSLRNDLKGEYEASLEQLMSANANAISLLEKNLNALIQAEVKYTQGQFYASLEDPNVAAVNFLYSIPLFFSINKVQSASIAMQNCSNQLLKANKDGIQEEFKDDKTSFEEQIRSIKSFNLNAEHEKLISDLEKSFVNLA